MNGEGRFRTGDERPPNLPSTSLASRAEPIYTEVDNRLRIRPSDMSMTPSDPILEQQIAYYRARAHEYDQWFLRQGRYDRGPERNRQWLSEVQELRAHLDRFRPTGRVLELACGTGWWTEQLLRHADCVTAVDASLEVLALNRARVGAERVRFLQQDLFQWQPTEQYDVIFFS